ncbi:MAG TPA: dTMP kinase [Elusimicrobia bacterium]|nr:dTMP kinase [Elusimicrobiota bacterium]HBT61313.1 dTMP kinase [Elusimicrobiota bacterium]
MKGRFIVLEGPDKSGKSTQAGLLARHLRRQGVALLLTREPGGTGLSEAVRKLLLDPRRRVDPLAELFLYEAARAQHTREKILPALSAGRWVLSERYSLATMAYQGYARGLSMPMIRILDRIATGGLRPDLTVIMDIPESEFSIRDQARRLDRLERESLRFRKLVREGYRKLARREPGCALINGRQPVAQVHANIVRLVERLRP